MSKSLSPVYRETTDHLRWELHSTIFYILSPLSHVILLIFPSLPSSVALTFVGPSKFVPPTRPHHLSMSCTRIDRTIQSVNESQSPVVNGRPGRSRRRHIVAALIHHPTLYNTSDLHLRLHLSWRSKSWFWGPELIAQSYYITPSNRRDLEFWIPLSCNQCCITEKTAFYSYLILVDKVTIKM